MVRATLCDVNWKSRTLAVRIIQNRNYFNQRATFFIDLYKVNLYVLMRLNVELIVSLYLAMSELKLQKLVQVIDRLRQEEELPRVKVSQAAQA